MASKETYVAPPPFNTQLSPCLECREFAQHLIPSGWHLCIGNHVCMLTFIRFGKFRLFFSCSNYELNFFSGRIRLEQTNQGLHIEFLLCGVFIYTGKFCEKIC